MVPILSMILRCAARGGGFAVMALLAVEGAALRRTGRDAQCVYGRAPGIEPDWFEGRIFITGEAARW